jgi:membrane protein implicated in regulation of membrane protease activity
MKLRRMCLAALILAPWLAVTGAVAAIYGLLTPGGVWWAAAGCAALVVASEASVRAYKVLKTRPAVSRAEAVRRLPGSDLGPPFAA